MNIKRAKQEIKDTIEAYLLKDERGEYCIPSVRQRPVLLILSLIHILSPFYTLPMIRKKPSICPTELWL